MPATLVAMEEERPILLERGHGRKKSFETVFIPVDTILAAAATELRRASDGVKGTYGQYGRECVGVYRPPRSYKTTEVDVFTGEKGETHDHPVAEDCWFYHFDGVRLTSVAVASFDTDPPAIRLLRTLATEVQRDLFAEPGASPRKEGARRDLVLTSYERDPLLRAACISHHGARCAACGIAFGATYGSIAEGFIHVHHRQPLAEVGEEHAIDPITDLVPLCPNCHAVAHLREPPLTPEEIADMLGENGT
jgi:hypothetical protein